VHLADATGSPPEWRGGAACRHHDPDLFFPEGTAGPALRQADQAKRVCQSCPVRTPCLGFALRHGVAFGIWGGATAEERRQGTARLDARHKEYHAGNQVDGDQGGSFRDGHSSSTGAA
jgi:WhiB family redox-sensing transcriptional regulator